MFSVIIRYKIPYFTNSQRLILTLALGASISLSTILGIPSLKAIHGVLDLCHKKIFFNQLNLTLSMAMTEPHDCFPPLQHVNLYSTLLFHQMIW